MYRVMSIRGGARLRSSRAPTPARSPAMTGTSASRICTTPTLPSTPPAMESPRTGSWWTAPAGCCAPPGRPPPRSRRRRPSIRRAQCSTCRRSARSPTAPRPRRRLSPLVTGYRTWLDDQRAELGDQRAELGDRRAGLGDRRAGLGDRRAELGDLTGERREVAEQLLRRRCRRCTRRAPRSSVRRELAVKVRIRGAAFPGARACSPHEQSRAFGGSSIAGWKPAHPEKPSS